VLPMCMYIFDVDQYSVLSEFFPEDHAVHHIKSKRLSSRCRAQDLYNPLPPGVVYLTLRKLVSFQFCLSPSMSLDTFISAASDM
jgi:hypothetical protein